MLYAPTWRDDVLDADGRRDVDLCLDLEEFSRRFAGTHVLLLRLHYMLSGRLAAQVERGEAVLPPGVVDVSAHPDIAELYLAADAMVTDYSSTLFDFAVTGKPLVLFAYDLEHYRDDVRGFYFDLFVAPAGAGAAHQRGAPRRPGRPGRSDAPAWEGAAAAFRAEHCPADDGGAARRVLDLVLPGRGDGPSGRRGPRRRGAPDGSWPERWCSGEPAAGRRPRRGQGHPAGPAAAQAADAARRRAQHPAAAGRQPAVRLRRPDHDHRGRRLQGAA